MAAAVASGELADWREVVEDAPDSKCAAGSFELTEEVNVIHIDLNGSEDKTVRVGTSISTKQESTLIDFLYANRGIFAWKPLDMPGIPREVAEHSLDNKLTSRLVKQRLCRFDEKRRRAIGEEIEKLLSAGFIKEVYHPEWLGNLLVRKKSRKWRMCIDYTGLNKACPKDPFPLPRIGQVVDSTSGCEALSFLDAYSGHHQIAMKESDQLASSFITPYVSYCYVMMPFRLNNTGVTYQQ
jgi:hypothetical protein